MSNTVTFIDNIGRTFLAEEVSRDQTTLKVKNPAVVHVVPNQQTGQLQVQLIPLFLTELLDPQTKSEGTFWTYNLSQITLGEVKIETRLLAQYTQAFAQIPVQPDNGPAVVKLFDE